MVVLPLLFGGEIPPSGYAEPSHQIDIELGNETRVNNYTAGDQVTPSIAVSPSDHIFVAWSSWNQTRWEIHFSKSLDRINFSKDRRITTANESNETTPRLAYASGRLYIVWVSENSSGRNIFFASSLNEGDTFTSPVQINTGAVNPYADHPVIAASSNMVYVCWMDNRSGNWDIYLRVSDDSGVSFGPDVLVTRSPANQRFPSIALNGSTQVFITWTDDRNGDEDIYAAYSTDCGQSFSLPVRINDDMTVRDQHESIIGVDQGGRIWIFWIDLREKTPSLYYTITGNLSRISFNERVLRTRDSPAEITAVFTSVPTLFWRNSSSKKVMYSQYNHSGFVPESYLTGENSTQGSPAGAGSPNGGVYVCWSDSRNGDLDIYMKSGDGTGPLITVSSPRDNQVVNLKGVDISYSATDPSGMPSNSVSLYYTLDWYTWSLIASSLPNSGVFHWDPPGGFSGNAGIRVTAYDLQQNPGIKDVRIYLDTLSPSVILISPHPDEKDVSPGTEITMKFSEPMNHTITELGFTLTSEKPVIGVFTWSGTVMKFKPTSLLEVGHEYIIRLGNAEDANGNPLAVPVESRFITIDLWPPEVTITSPRMGEVWDSHPHLIKYNVIENGTIPSNSVEISYSCDNGSSWTIIASGLNFTREYLWNVPSGIETSDARIKVTVRDLAGNAGWNVSERFRIDSILPLVNSTYPSNGSADVPVGSSIVIQFNEPMNRSSVEKSFSLTSARGKVSGSFDWKGTTVTFTPVQDLDSYTTYWYNFSGSDLAGNTISPVAIQFRTRDTLPPAITILSPSADQYVNGTGPFRIRYTISDQTEIRPRSINISVRYSPGNSSWEPIPECWEWNDLTSCPWNPPDGVEMSMAFLRVEASDRYGNLGSSVSDGFIVDTVAPSVISTNPQNNETGVPLHPDIVIIFSERMIQSSVETTIQPHVEMVASWSSNTTMLLRVKNPQDSLIPGRYYMVVITGGKDIAGNPIKPYNFTFRTTLQNKGGSIAGVVISIGGALLSGVDIILMFNESVVNTCKTGENATFRFTDLIPGEYVITFHKDGYYNKTLRVRVEAQKETNLGAVVLVFISGQENIDWMPLLVLFVAAIALTIVMIFVYIKSQKIEETETLVKHLAGEHRGSDEGKEPEKKREVPEEVQMVKGYSYLFLESEPDRGYRHFSRMVLGGMMGVCITTMHPGKIWEERLSPVAMKRKEVLGEKFPPVIFYDLEKYTGREKERHARPPPEITGEGAPGTVGFIMLAKKKRIDPMSFHDRVLIFMREHPDSVILIDSLSEFISLTGDSYEEILRSMVNRAKGTRSILIVSSGEIDDKIRENLKNVFHEVVCSAQRR